MQHGVVTCPVCRQVMCETIIDCDDYYACSTCGHKQRIFHQPVRRVPRFEPGDLVPRTFHKGGITV